MQPDSWRWFRAFLLIPFFACLALFAIAKAYAGAKDELSGANGEVVPLQRVINNERVRGPVFVSIPVAYVFGLAGGESTYCSPSIRATNSSNAVVEELVVGIEYRTAAGQSAGKSVTRYDNVKIQRQETHSFNQLASGTCKGLEGTVTVLRCIYSTGEDCSRDVQIVAFGAIPLHLKPR